MTFSFTESKSYLYTSESVTEGHPDKLSDQISDAILDSFISQDPNARVACEVCTTTGLIVVMGEVTIKKGHVDIPEVVRDTIKKVGYTNPTYGFDYKSTGVLVSIDKQSEDIAGGVDVSLETRDQENKSADPLDTLGAGDQGMMVGFACNETPELMPLSISLAHKLCKKMSDVRKNGDVSFLRPDGKAQVTIEYSYGKPKRIHTVVLSTQHDPDVSQKDIETALFKNVINEVLPKNLIDNDTIYHINPSGRFVIGGPVGDAGLTGRKIIVDTYGGVARHGGGAFSGKDPTKVDRSAAYAARQVAKTIVAAKLADRAEIQLSYAIGISKPLSISIETFGTNKIPDPEIISVVNRHFDLRPGAIIDNLNLRRPIYSQTAAYGHFGRDDLNLPWENTGKAKIIMDEMAK